MSEVKAAGAVLWREDGGTVQVAVVHRPKYDDWSLPKGKLEPSEPWVAAAVREVREETGFQGVVGRSLGTSSYSVTLDGRKVGKTVRWWAMRAASGEFEPGKEVDELAWLPVEQAAARVTAGSDDGVLERFAAARDDTCTILLVRHARAGDPSSWDGDDDERPLDPAGRRQAEVLAAVLPLWKPEAVLTAPPLRCRQTVQPLVDRLGLPCTVDADLAESASPALADRLRHLAQDGRTVMACSQGGVIPVAVATLAADAGLALGHVFAPKASLWALTFAADRLVQAELTSDLTST